MSARSMIIVLALETSSPDSTIVVHTSTSKRFSQKSSITCSSWCSPIWPWAVATRASGTSSLILVGRLLDRLHPVVDVEDLAVAEQLASYGGGDLAVLVGTDVGQHRVPLLRRGRDRGHLADAGDRHLQGARDRRRGHGEHVDAGAQRLHLLLVLDAEALLLVDDDQAEVLDLDVAVEQPVGADDDVDAAVGQALDDLAGLLVGLEPAQRLQRHREAAHPLGEGGVVLGDEQRRRHQDGDLLAVLHRLERGPHGDLGLAVADVAADQPVHRVRRDACRP